MRSLGYTESGEDGKRNKMAIDERWSRLAIYFTAWLERIQFVEEEGRLEEMEMEHDAWTDLLAGEVTHQLVPPPAPPPPPLASRLSHGRARGAQGVGVCGTRRACPVRPAGPSRVG